MEELGDGVTISNVENIIGSQGVDTLTGDEGDNIIEGGESGDTLKGGGGEGKDTLSYASSDDWVRVSLAGGETASRGHASGDTFSGFVNITGSGHDDDLTGNGEGNVLKGGDGDDDLVGGLTRALIRWKAALEPMSWTAVFLMLLVKKTLATGQISTIPCPMQVRTLASR